MCIRDRYLCLADSDFKLDCAFSFLEAVKDKVNKTFSETEINTANSFGDGFRQELETLIIDYNKDPESDKAKAIIANLTDLKNIAAENINKVLERDIKIEVVLQKSNAMKGVSHNYKATAREYKIAMMRRYIGCTMVLVLVLLISVYFIISLICGFSLDKCIKKEEPKQYQ
eukprot:TRINITY_DN4584_c0_g1_i10.p2 TRINITY_DN4584_c0_g1~~TRINITY_DN4584_c0_g1_i10.p2  ORF type:complete len:171 (-),score=37.27 TRINITY_DN4584_c0_g1_i10:64-576(-)